MSFKSKFLRWLPFVIIGIYVISLVFAQFSKIDREKLKLSRAIKTKFKNINAIMLKRGDINDYIWAQGRVEPIKSVTIKSEITKKITYINVQLGQWVKKGDLLFCLDEEDSVANYMNAKAALLSTEANFKYADEDYKNKQKLAENGFNEITEDVLRLSERTMESTKALKLQAEASLESAEYMLGKTIFIAPFDGLITELNYRTENELVNANSIIARITDLSTLKLTASVTADDVTYLNIGVVTEQLDTGHRILDIKGKITGISANASDSGTFRIEIEYDNPNLKTPELKSSKLSESELKNFSKVLSILKLQPTLPQNQVIRLNPDILLGSTVARSKIPKGVLKNAFIVPANAVVRDEGANYVCEIQRLNHPIYTFGAEDVVNIDLVNFVPVEVYKYIDNQAIIYSEYLNENIYVAVSGQKSVNQGESVIVKSVDNE